MCSHAQCCLFFCVRMFICYCLPRLYIFEATKNTKKCSTMTRIATTRYDAMRSTHYTESPRGPPHNKQIVVGGVGCHLDTREICHGIPPHAPQHTEQHSIFGGVLHVHVDRYGDVVHSPHGGAAEHTAQLTHSFAYGALGFWPKIA